jgi:hypothetical protein
MKSKRKDCAKLILYWHRNFGIEIATESFKQETYYKYKELPSLPIMIGHSPYDKLV